MLDDLILSLVDENIMSHWSKYAHLVSTHPIISSDAFNPDINQRSRTKNGMSQVLCQMLVEE